MKDALPEGVADCATERDVEGRVEREVVGRREALVDTDRVRVSVVEVDGEERWEGLALGVRVPNREGDPDRRALAEEVTSEAAQARSAARAMRRRGSRGVALMACARVGARGLGPRMASNPQYSTSPLQQRRQREKRTDCGWGRGP